VLAPHALCREPALGRDEIRLRNKQNPMPRKNQFDGVNPAVQVQAVLDCGCPLLSTISSHRQ